jgi:hypothetical protein
MIPRHEPSRNLPDQVNRDSLKNPANLREFLHAAVPELAAGLDCDRAEAEVFHRVFTEAAKRLAELQGREEVRWSDCLRVILTYA